MADYDHGLGFDADAAAQYKTLMRAGTHATVSDALTVVTPAKTLIGYRRRALRQGQAGTCWLHAPTQHAEIAMTARGLKGFDVCRRLVGWAGQQFMGGRNPSDGGSGGNAYRAMAETGLAHEDLCPYTDARRQLGTRPPAEVFTDAQAVHLTVPVDVTTIDQALTLIDHGDTPISFGLDWSREWDASQTFMLTTGRVVGGHEILMVGYAGPGVFGDSRAWVQFENWHGDLYPRLTPALAAKVAGYPADAETMVSHFWVERRLLDSVMSSRNADMVSAGDLTGLESGVLVPSAKGVLPF